MNTSKREFLKKALGLTGLALIAPAVMNSLVVSKAQAAELPLLDPNDPLAKGVKYAADKKDVKDAAVKTERQGVKWDAQKCDNCSFFTADGAGVGKCVIFAGKHVKSAAWCTSWTKKA